MLIEENSNTAISLLQALKEHPSIKRIILSIILPHKPSTGHYLVLKRIIAKQMGAHSKLARRDTAGNYVLEFSS